jgi:hypothetical protein
MLRAQRRRETVTEGGWAELPDELVTKVLGKVLQAEEGGFGFTQAHTEATVRLVSAGWKAVHDALVTRLVLRGQTTDEAMGILVRRFPAVSVAGAQERRRARVDGRRLVDRASLLQAFLLPGRQREAPPASSCRWTTRCLGPQRTFSVSRMRSAAEASRAALPRDCIRRGAS